MNWFRKLFSRDPRGVYTDPGPLSELNKWGLSRPEMPDPHIQAALARNARADRAQRQFVMNELVKRTQRPERTLRYFAVMARREIGRQKAHLVKTEDSLFQLEQALDILEESITKWRT